MSQARSEWEFPDAQPWHLQVSNGDTRVAPGLAPSPTVTLRCSFEDWADLIGGRQDGLRLAATAGSARAATCAGCGRRAACSRARRGQVLHSSIPPRSDTPLRTVMLECKT